mmetsp:Transcript_40511/g.100568  ORF Transcript_40511/g.100568 Transcript_40511/m.100568 type:complete len:205 (+) Transcript_40511:1129-1743(+)
MDAGAAGGAAGADTTEGAGAGGRGVGGMVGACGMAGEGTGATKLGGGAGGGAAGGVAATTGADAGTVGAARSEPTRAAVPAGAAPTYSSISAWFASNSAASISTPSAFGPTVSPSSAFSSFCSNAVPASTAASSFVCARPTAVLDTSSTFGSSFTSLSSFDRRDLSDWSRITSNCTPMQNRYTPFESCTGRIVSRFSNSSPLLR